MNAADCPILLVEDNPGHALLIQRALSRCNPAHPIRVVQDGEEAIAYLAGAGDYAERQRHPLPVLVLLDLKLPRKSGLEVLAWIRQTPGLKRLPVVVLTSSRESVDVNRAYDLGANSYLAKPIAFDSLAEVLRNLNLYWLVLNEMPQIGESP
jgi:CheY-like chemotaxis protein